MIADHSRHAGWLAFLSVVLLLLVVWSFSVGRFPVAPADVTRALWSAISGSDSGLAKNVEAVILQVRAPRLFAALLVGASLAAAGAAFQNLFKNPLVSPDILGVSAGCALGAGLAILASLPVVAVQGWSWRSAPGCAVAILSSRSS
jgi:iron complex transport system permease protein